MFRTLLVDTNRSALPIYDALINGGHEVTVVGRNPHDYLASAASSYRQVDYADINAFKDLLAAESFDWVVPGCNDQSYSACSAVNTDYGYPGIDSLDVFDTINRKDRFRALATQIGLSVPRVYRAGETEFEWPVIVKPVDAFSGRGVTRLDSCDSDAFAAAVEDARNASPSNAWIVEQFVEGQLYSHSAFLQDGRVVTDFIVVEYGTVNPFAVDTSWVTSDFPLTLLQRIREDVARLVSALGLRNGLVHTQFIVRNDCYWFIEVTRRCPGDLYALLIEFSTGFPYGCAYASPFIGECLPLHTLSEPRAVLRHTVSGASAGVLSGLCFENKVAIRLFVPLAAAGDRLGVGPSGRVGILFLDAEDSQSLAKLAQLTLNRALYTIL